MDHDVDDGIGEGGRVASSVVAACCRGLLSYGFRRSLETRLLDLENDKNLSLGCRGHGGRRRRGELGEISKSAPYICTKSEKRNMHDITDNDDYSRHKEQSDFL